MPYRDFGNWKNPVFVETGSYMGDGIQAALDAGFEKIISIELSPKYFTHCNLRFRNNPKVQIAFGDSSKILWDLIKDIDTPITFWLDGHWSGDDTAKGEIPYPILSELYQITKHPINTHTILIDDVRLFVHQWDLGATNITDLLFSINPYYILTLETGYTDQDVLVADAKGKVWIP